MTGGSVIKCSNAKKNQTVEPCRFDLFLSTLSISLNIYTRGGFVHGNLDIWKENRQHCICVFLTLLFFNLKDHFSAKKNWKVWKSAIFLPCPPVNGKYFYLHFAYCNNNSLRWSVPGVSVCLNGREYSQSSTILLSLPDSLQPLRDSKLWQMARLRFYFPDEEASLENNAHDL